MIRFHAHTSEHHIRLYPPRRFLNEKSLISRDPNAKFYYPLLASIFLVSYLFLGGAFFGIVCCLHIGFELLFADYLHEGFHAKGFWLEKYRCFVALRELHYLHHKGHMTGPPHSRNQVSQLQIIYLCMISGWICFWGRLRLGSFKLKDELAQERKTPSCCSTWIRTGYPKDEYDIFEFFVSGYCIMDVENTSKIYFSVSSKSESFPSCSVPKYLSP